MPNQYTIDEQAVINVTVANSAPVSSVSMSETNTQVVWDTPTYQQMSSTQVQITTTPRTNPPGITLSVGTGNTTIVINHGNGPFDTTTFPTYYMNPPN